MLDCCALGRSLPRHGEWLSVTVRPTMPDAQDRTHRRPSGPTQGRMPVGDDRSKLPAAQEAIKKCCFHFPIGCQFFLATPIEHIRRQNFTQQQDYDSDRPKGSVVLRFLTRPCFSPRPASGRMTLIADNRIDGRHPVDEPAQRRSPAGEVEADLAMPGPHACFIGWIVKSLSSPGRAEAPLLLRRWAVRSAAILAQAVCVACSAAPAQDVFGSFVPSWLLCAR